MAISKSLKVNVAKYIASITFEEFRRTVLESDYSSFDEVLNGHRKKSILIYRRIANIMGIISSKNTNNILLEKRLIDEIIKPAYNMKVVEQNKINELLKSDIDEIIKKEKTGAKGHLMSAFKYRLFKDDVEEGIELLKEKNGQSLIDLIDSDLDLRTSIFVSASMVEGFTNTLVLSSDIKGMFPNDDFKRLILPGDKSKWIRDLSPEKTLGKHFNKFTLGKKVLFLSRLNESLFRNLLGPSRSKKISKSMIINSLKIWVDIRNDAAHDGFIALPILFNKLPYNQPKDFKGSKPRYILKQLDIIMEVIGHKGKFTKSFNDIKKKYQGTLKLHTILK